MPKHQSKIEKLIAELCPDGVVLSTLSDVAHFMNGKGHEKHIDENGRFIVVNSKFVSTEGIVKKYSVKQISPVSENDILMVMSDLPNGKALAKCFYVDENDKYTLNQRICALTVKDNKGLNTKFLFYILNRNEQLLRYDSGADQTNLRKDDILNIQIPIPPLAIQQEIVKILDTFTTLEAELEARKKQYVYYRDELLNIRDVEFKKLGEVGSLIRGNGLQKKDFVEDGVGCIHYGQIYGCGREDFEMVRTTLAFLTFPLIPKARHAAMWTPSMAEEDSTERVNRDSRSLESLR